MNASEQTFHQIERALRKAAAKCPTQDDDPILTDLYLQVKQDSGELLIFDDDEQELTRCVVEEWMGNNDEDFYEKIQPLLQSIIQNNKELIDSINLLRPFSLVLTGEDHETVTELYLVDDNNIIISQELMEGLSEDLDEFWKKLAAE